MKRFKILILLLMITGVMAILGPQVKADTKYEVKIEDITFEVMFNPVTYEEHSKSFADITDEIVLYSPRWHYNNTNRNENTTDYIAIWDSLYKYKIEAIEENANETFIPLDGIVISIPEDSTYSFEIGQIVDVASLRLTAYNKAIENEDGVRMVISRINENRRASSFSFYNSTYGPSTDTVLGSEMTAYYNPDGKGFEVMSLGKGGNSDIPFAGFVISTTGRPHEYMLNDGVVFSKGDILTIVGFDFIELEQSFTHPFSAINGTRYENALIIYPASSNPSLKTNTNEYGFEVAVDSDGYVIEMSTNVSIPEGGFVLSGHGSGRDFLMNQIEMSAKITYDSATKLITVTNSMIEQSVRTIRKNHLEAENQKNTALEELYDVDIPLIIANYENATTLYNRVEALKIMIDDAEELMDALLEIEEFLLKIEEIKEIHQMIYFDSIVSSRIEQRGVWHRPNEQNLNQIKATLDALALMNFTDVYVEAFWNGYVIYPSELAPYQTKIGSDFDEYGNDYLKAFIAEAAKRDILVHAWVENFFVGVTGHYSDLWNEYPEWRIKNYNGLEIQTGKPYGEEEGFMFFDPANPDVQDFILSIYEEMLKNYNLAGLHLDYIRYPSVNTDITYSSGYTDYAMNEFKEMYDVSGNVRQLVLSDSKVAGDWNRYRQNVINLYVERAHHELREIKSNIALTIAVGPDANYAKVNLMQDWKLWVENGWIDAVLPMAYVNGVVQLENIVVRSKIITGDVSFNYTGLAPAYDGLPELYNSYYVEASMQAGAHGTAMFASHNLVRNNSIINILNQGVYRNKSVAPHHTMNKILEIFVSDQLHKSETIYMPYEVMTEQQFEAFEAKLNSLLDEIYENPHDFQRLYDELDMIYLELTRYASGKAVVRITEDINYLLEVIDIKINRYLINNGFWDVTKSSERPDFSSFEFPVQEIPTEPEPTEIEPTPTEVDETPKKVRKPVVLALSIGIPSISGGLATGLFFIFRRRRLLK